MAAMSERKAQPPRSARRRSRGLARKRADARQERGQNFLPRRSGRSGRAARRRRRGWRAARARRPARLCFERQTVAGRRGGDGDRIGDPIRLPRASRNGSQSQAARAAATKAEPCAVVSSRRSAEAASATARSFDLDERRPVAGLRRAEGGGEQDRVGARRAEGREGRPASRRASARRKCRRPPPPIRARANRRTRRPGRPATATA